MPDDISEKIESRFERFSEKLFEHDDQFEKLSEKIDEQRRLTLTHYDEMMVILKRLDQERLATLEWLQRADTKIDREIDRNDIQDQRLEKLEFGVAVA